MNRLLHFIFFLFTVQPLFAQYPNDVEEVLQKSGKNRIELEKAINYFKHNGDSLKLKAIYFLVANMDIHYSADYYWTDSLGSRIPFNELDYPDFASSVRAFEQIKHKYGKVKPVAFTYRDIETIKADYLINNVQKAFESCTDKTFSPESFAVFCEYVLPYRTSIEPLQPWRAVYYNEFHERFSRTEAETEKRKLWQFASDLEGSAFNNSFGFEKRKEPLPRLGALQLLHRKKGPCEDMVAFKVFALRAQGVPSCVDVIPYWATSSGGHFLPNAFGLDLNPISLEVISGGMPASQLLAREPAKVLRTTYSRQKGILASIADTSGIPDGILRMQNYIDVTADYWKTQSVTCRILKNKAPIAYACVFNYSGWKPAWWGKVDNGAVTFSNMPQGTVILPSYYLNGKLEPAGYPVAVVNDTQKELIPNLKQLRSIMLPWQQNYLVYRVGSRYRLYYWDNAWKLLGEQTAVNTEQMVFNNVPSNALLLLRPEYSKGKERPFIIDEQGQRTWW